MRCTRCGGAVEYIQNFSVARCLQCGLLHTANSAAIAAMPGQPTDQAQSTAFAQSLGFGPPGTNPTTPPWERQQQQQQGGGMPNIGVKVNIPGMTSFTVGTQGASVDTKRLEKNLVNKAKDKIFVWVVTAIIGLIVLLACAGFGIYLFFSVRSSSTSPPPTAAAVEAKWDGKSTFTCTDGNHEISGVTATAGVSAGGNCKLTLKNVNITAATCVDAEANAEVTIVGGSLNGSAHAISAGANAKVTTSGTTVTGKQTTSALAKINGAAAK